MKHAYALLVFSFLMGLWVLSSCRTQNLAFSPVSTASDSSMFANASAQLHVIRPDDKLSLSIHGHDDLSIGSLYGIYNSNEVYGKWILVDYDSMATLPRLGEVKLAGMTVAEAEDTLRVLYGKAIVNPIVKVKVLNRQVQILGEVKAPGIQTLEKEHNTLAEMIARSGDFDFYANKRRVQVVRMVNDTLKAMTINMTRRDQSQYAAMNLRAGDLVYVPAKKGKDWDKRSGSIITVSGVITSLVIISQLFK